MCSIIYIFCQLVLEKQRITIVKKFKIGHLRRAIWRRLTTCSLVESSVHLFWISTSAQSIAITKKIVVWRLWLLILGCTECGVVAAEL